ncbi:CCA tRNA nucleotidyltransferase [Rhodoplanes sp. TEM]|uniref:CCA tRNA nucleotidyltransferase n=1 Tax=Rhodoplanes tepidamans TaxID=200616 RepID=A0ABT5J5K6_RHOTP|nr:MULTISPECIES: CCA tRNA nucleotidyltransferase [Rhodoplanes]MDC7784922.1 CCA tRNA nucleotidyltransferase [Rhodoplanes tepidamans]MDC7983982.1 CCA tRNA nucleotidyltransferase [Rhodoplanes sp. TEM]MDQ0353849.1 poly(A) polymerase [Rhodoplanes tepidamans]
MIARRIVGAGWLDAAPLAAVLALLDRDGEEARVVGGAVRNTLLGEPPGDIDIATTARPEEVMRRARAAGLKAVPTGIDHGTVTIVAGGTPFEVTTLREDVETFGRKATVAFGRDWGIDAARRDFTMNALSLSPDGTLHDPVGGLADLEARRVRFIGDPERRIDEDHLRILRFFRFHASYGNGAFDPASLHACIVGREKLRGLSRERVRMELMKLLVAPVAAGTLGTMADAGILQLVLGGIGRPWDLATMVAREHALGLPPDATRRLGALAVLIAEDADRLRDRLRLTNGEHRRLAVMAEGWWRLGAATSDAEARVLLYRLGPGPYADRLLLAWTRAGSDGAGEPAAGAWTSLATLPQRWTAPRFPIRAARFMAHGLAGAALGAAMKDAEATWIAQGFPADAASLDAIVRSALAGSASAR